MPRHSGWIQKSSSWSREIVWWKMDTANPQCADRFNGWVNIPFESEQPQLQSLWIMQRQCVEDQTFLVWRCRWTESNCFLSVETSRKSAHAYHCGEKSNYALMGNLLHCTRYPSIPLIWQSIWGLDVHESCELLLWYFVELDSSCHHPLVVWKRQRAAWNSCGCLQSNIWCISAIYWIGAAD